MKKFFGLILSALSLSSLYSMEFREEEPGYPLYNMRELRALMGMGKSGMIGRELIEGTFEAYDVQEADERAYQELIELGVNALAIRQRPLVQKERWLVRTMKKESELFKKYPNLAPAIKNILGIRFIKEDDFTTLW